MQIRVRRIQSGSKVTPFAGVWIEIMAYLCDNIKIMPTIFHFWGALSGLIQLAANKEEYIEKTTHLSKIQFLEYGFDMLYCTIEKGE